MLADLLAHPGVEEDVRLRSPFGFCAIHGGSLERGTAEVAALAAERAGASLYAVRQPEDLRWHVPSRAFDPRHSPALAAFLAHVDVVVSVHGYGRDGWWTTLLLGGGNRRLATHLAASLHATLPEYDVVDDLQEIPVALRGVHPENPVNRPRGGGVQLELPPRVRGMGPFWEGHEGRPVPHTVALVDGLVAAATSWASQAEPHTGAAPPTAS